MPPPSHPALRPVAHPTAIHHRIRTQQRPTRPPPAIPGHNTGPAPGQLAMERRIQQLEAQVITLQTENQQLQTHNRMLEQENNQLRQELEVTRSTMYPTPSTVLSPHTRRPVTPSAPPMYDPNWLIEAQHASNIDSTNSREVSTNSGISTSSTTVDNNNP